MTGVTGGPGAEPAVGAIVGGRDEQQDAARVERFDTGNGTPGLLLIVADGMGGHAGGREASRIAVETYGNVFLAEDGLPLTERLTRALAAANQAVGAAASESRALRDMGCTIVAAALAGGSLSWISVGDSLLLAVHDGRIERLNADHSLAPEIDRAALEGRLTPAEALSHPDRSVLLAALNGAPLNLVDEGERRLADGALLLLATDGILTLPDAQILAAAAGGGPAAAIVETLLGAIEADMPPEQDNTTLVAVRPHPASGAAAPRRRGRRLLGGLSLLVSLGGALWAVLILRESPPERPPIHPSAGPPVAAPVPPEAVAPARTAERTRRTAPVRIHPPAAQKKPPRAAPEPPHISLSMPGSRSGPAPRRPATPADRAAQKPPSGVERR